MISTQEEFYEKLYDIQINRPPSYAVLLPEAETIYDIDLNSRTIDTPEFLSVSMDHSSETVYFRIDRFFDYMDLSTTTAVIQYVTPVEKKARMYVVPFFDISGPLSEGGQKMIFPWCLNGDATFYGGEITYSIRFYKIDRSSGQYKLTYNLNTRPSKSQILYGIEYELANIYDFTLDTEGSSDKNTEPWYNVYDVPEDKYLEIYQTINQLTADIASNIGVWKMASDIDD